MVKQRIHATRISLKPGEDPIGLRTHKFVSVTNQPLRTPVSSRKKRNASISKAHITAAPAVADPSLDRRDATMRLGERPLT